MGRKAVAVGLLVSAGCLWLAFRGVPVREVLAAIAGARFAPLVPGAALMVLYFLLRAWRLGFLYEPHRIPGFETRLSSIMIGAFANNVLPGKLGELARVAVVARREGVSAGLSLGAILVERVFDLLALFTWVIAAVALSRGERELVAGGSLSAARLAFLSTLALFLALVAGLGALRLWSRGFERLARRGAGLVSPGLGERAGSLVALFAEGLRSLDRPRTAAVVLGASLAQWLLMSLVLWLCLSSFGLRLGLWPAILTTALLALGVTIPPAPGGIGPAQLFAVLILAHYGVPRETALGFGLVYNLLGLVVTSLAGWLFLVRESLSLGEIRRAGQAGQVG